MRRLVFIIGALAAGMASTFAADDPIAARQALMKANGKATTPLVAILKGGAFDLAVVQASLKTFIDAAEKGPALFPPGSDKGKTGALPAIWQNKSDFDARFAKLGEDSKAALVSVKDAATFKAAMPKIFKSCGGCHEIYRAKDE